MLYAWTNTAGDETYYTKTSTPSVGDQLFDETGTPAIVSNSYVNGEISVVFIYADGSITYARTDPNAMLGRDTSKDITLSTPKSETETISGITIRYYKADDGHKICMLDQEANVQALYEATGVAWYYIIDMINKQFKLPRTKFGFTGLRDEVGGYVEAGLPNITGKLYPLVSNSAGVSDWSTKTGVFKKSSGATSGAAAQGSTYAYRSAEFDASDSSPVYGNSNTVQPEATQMYLYFYVGNFERDALEQTAGITSEQLNDKADKSTVEEQLNNKIDKSEENRLNTAGMVMAFAGTTAPTGWLKCDGSAVSRERYADLFAAIGTTYGAGDGSTTFNLPTQSVLPLGTSAPVKTNKNNRQLQVMYGTLRLGITDGVTTSLLIPYNNNADNNYLRFESAGTAGYANMFADVANATGAKAIVCIKY